MAEIINFNKARKRSQRERRPDQASHNRVLHGRSKVERLQQQGEAKTGRRHLDGQRLDPDTPDPKEPA